MTDNNYLETRQKSTRYLLMDFILKDDSSRGISDQMFWICVDICKKEYDDYERRKDD